MSTLPVLSDDARIAIVNRGEAALRFIRAVREYNDLYDTDLKTVALYMDVEEDALFVKMADDQVQLSSLAGYPGKKQSPYLDHELMLSAISKADAQGIWVGWGFVSEDSDFAEKVEQAGIVFMGPSSRSMALLGDKIKAKELAESADVPILPWSKRAVKDIEDAKKMAESIGYPVIVKASNAGGGRGIRFVRTPEELAPQFKSAQEETVRITGNDIVFIEHLVEKGRHLEVQALADMHGHVNTFGVRDCSVQRKNQKIIEETPPPHLSSEAIKEIEESAARMIKSAEYVGAGTVEYLYDLHTKRFYFMEVNTRLQVEHPITETLYSIDLVKGQIHVARGKTVDWSDAQPKGHVIEVRLNAEAPEKDFTPAPGAVEIFKAPAGPGIRVDSGVEQGSTIPSEFDSMIAKIISYAPSRKEAVSRLKRALNEMRIRIKNGTTNRAFLLELLQNKEIAEGGVSTGFVEHLLKTKKADQDIDKVKVALLSGAIELYHTQLDNDFINFKEQISRLGRPRTSPESKGYSAALSAFGNKYNFTVKHVGCDEYHILMEGDEENIICCKYTASNREGIIIYNEKRYNVLIVPRGDMLQIEIDGYPVYLESESGGAVKSPSPAVVLNVNTAPGRKVKKGDLLLVLEAMKMEMLVESPGDGIVKEISVSPGSQVAAGATLAVLELGEEGESEVVSTMPSVEYTGRKIGLEDQYHRTVMELHALFLGYDQTQAPSAVLDNLLSFCEKHDSFKSRLKKDLLALCRNYITIENLFSQKEVVTDSFNRPVTYEEMLSHYFQRENDKEKGLPEEFVSNLKKTFSCYTANAKPSNDEIDIALFHIFRAHGRLKEKQNLVATIFFTLEQLGLPVEMEEEFTEIVDDIVLLTHAQAQAQALAQRIADAALHSRYQIIDKKRIDLIRADEKENITGIIHKLLAGSVDGRPRLMDAAVNSGAFIHKILIDFALSGDTAETELALEIFVKHFNRDRRVTSLTIKKVEGIPYVYAECITGYGIKYDTILLIADEKQFEKIQNTSEFINGFSQSGNKQEAIILVQSASKERTAAKEKITGAPKGFYRLVTVGWFYENDNFFRTFGPINDEWKELELFRGFDPLKYRELRVFRLSNFHLKILYKSDAVTVLEGTARDNSKDKRLFALASTSETNPVIEAQDISQMIVFDAALNEAISALRAAQSRYKYRLQWNRIIMHNRSLLGLRLMQMKEYGKRFIPRVKDLGLEKMVVYSRRKRWREDVIRELELLFLNISNDQFSLRSRTPTNIPLTSLDTYVGKVVRARQRNTVFPYELIKSITNAGIPIEESIPKGEFKEYDIEIDENAGSQKIVPALEDVDVTDKSNIVFGIISNYDTVLDMQVKRVIILSDSTKDFGSLAEPECRRINAALDLAEKHGIPVEWIPVSSGAKITMDSGTENLDWTAATLKRIIRFTQEGGEINIIVPNINVGAQSYWNAEATMLMHTKGLLIMTDDASMLLTGKKALDFAGSVSGETNLDIGGAEKIMVPNGQAQLRAANLQDAYKLLFSHYRYTYCSAGEAYPVRIKSKDPVDRDVSKAPYNDFLNQGFVNIGDIFSIEKNPERKKPFDMRQVMEAIVDNDAGYFERWRGMKDADTGIVWESRIGGYAAGIIGIESRNISRIGSIPFDGPETWNGGTLFPLSSKKVARGINAFSGRLPLVIVANLSGFDGSPESLRNLQLEYGAEIGRAIVNFKGPIVFLVTARYHGGAYVVFSKSLNENLTSAAIEGSYASVIGGAPAAAVVFPKQVIKDTYNDRRIIEKQEALKNGRCSQKDFDDLYKDVYREKQTELGNSFDKIHSVERAKSVGSIDDIVTPSKIRPYIIQTIEKGMKKGK